MEIPQAVCRPIVLDERYDVLGPGYPEHVCVPVVPGTRVPGYPGTGYPGSKDRNSEFPIRIPGFRS
eukprot:3880972-Rhodomonas_salina.1